MVDGSLSVCCATWEQRYPRSRRERLVAVFDQIVGEDEVERGERTAVNGANELIRPLEWTLDSLSG
jgi:hypothetical protein